MSRTEKLERFRQLHEREGLFLFPNPWDAGSARILAALGFEALATTSAGYAFAAGLRDDIGALDRNGVIENARQIVDATDLPVAADLADGFGEDPAACALTIERAVAAGLVGGSIEDATADPSAPIFPLGQAVERVAAAAETASKLGFVLTARAEEWLYRESDLDATIERLNAFAAVGADVLYAPGLPSLEAIAQVCELADAGVKRISVGGSLARAAYGALIEGATEILGEGTFGYASRAASSSEIKRLIG